MNWLNKIVEDTIKQHPTGEIVVSSGVSPSGTYHLGTLREVLTAEIIARELGRRGRKARHIHNVDDHDVFRKVPVNVPKEWDRYLGMPLRDVPAPDGSKRSYADYFLADLQDAAKKMKLQMEVVHSGQKYDEGFFAPAIEKALLGSDKIRQILQDISGRKLDEGWSPIQIVEEGYLKSRQFKAIDTKAKTVTYVDKDGKDQQISYSKGEVKLNWRVDWPARWWLMRVNVEPFGRDHATKGGSYDTGKAIVEKIFGATAPLPVPYNFINRTGDTKKMSKSAGDTITASELLNFLPVEIVWFFLLRASPDKLLFFDEGEALMKLFDDFAMLLVKPDKTDQEKQLLELCLHGIDTPTASNIPFSHLVASYQASLKNPEETLKVIQRTEHGETAKQDAEVIKKELKFIDEWLRLRAPEDIKFELVESVDPSQFTSEEKAFLKALGELVAAAPKDADGEYFHQAIYGLKDSSGLQPQQMFSALYRALIGKTSGPRAGWFLSILSREWLVERLLVIGE